jgi:hypothetical protein
VKQRRKPGLTEVQIKIVVKLKEKRIEIEDKLNLVKKDKQKK